MTARDVWRWTDERGVQRLVSTDELRAALVNGVLPLTTLVWREGMAEWVAASTVIELTGELIPADDAPELSDDEFFDDRSPVKDPPKEPAKEGPRERRSTLTGLASTASAVASSGGPADAKMTVAVPAASAPNARPVVTQVPPFGAPAREGEAAAPVVPPAPRVPAPPTSSPPAEKPKPRRKITTTEIDNLWGAASSSEDEEGAPRRAKPSELAAAAAAAAEATARRGPLVPPRKPPPPPPAKARLGALEGVVNKAPSAPPPRPPPRPIRPAVPTTDTRTPAKSSPAIPPVAVPAKPVFPPPRKRLSGPPSPRAPLPSIEEIAANATAAQFTMGAKGTPGHSTTLTGVAAVDPTTADTEPPAQDAPARDAPAQEARADAKPIETHARAADAKAAAPAAAPALAPAPEASHDDEPETRGRAPLRREAPANEVAAAAPPAAPETAPESPARSIVQVPDVADVVDLKLSEPPPAPINGAAAAKPALAHEADRDHAAEEGTNGAAAYAAIASGAIGPLPPPRLPPPTISSRPPPAAAPPRTSSSNPPPAVERRATSSHPPAAAARASRSNPPAAAERRATPSNPPATRSTPPPAHADADEIVIPRRRTLAEQVSVPMLSLLGAGALLIGMVIAAFFVGRASSEPAPRLTAQPTFAGVPTAARAALPPPPKPCWMVKQPAMWAPKASKSVPFDAVASTTGTLALGYARDAKDATGIEIDLATGEVHDRFAEKEGTEVERVVPTSSLAFRVARVGASGALKSPIEVPAASPFAVGLTSDGIALASPPGATPVPLWSLTGDEALGASSVHEAGERGFVLTYRRNGAIWGGFIGADRKASGELVKVAGSGGAVGKPAAGWNGREVAVIFADRPDENGKYEIRIGHASAGSVPAATAVLPLPKGGPGGDAFAPDIAGLADGRWVVMWTEGAAGSRAVRAQTLAADFAPIGDPIALSPPAGNFGQGVVAVVGEHVATIFLSKGSSSYELWGALLQCG